MMTLKAGDVVVHCLNGRVMIVELLNIDDTWAEVMSVDIYGFYCSYAVNPKNIYKVGAL